MFSKNKPPRHPPGSSDRPPRTTTLSPRVDNRWRGLTPPPDRRTPGTVLVTPDLPPPGPLFRRERGPRVVGRHVPPSPKEYNPYPYERIPVAARPSSVQSVRGLVNSPTTPWSREADHGSTLSVPVDPLVATPDSLIPTEGSVISDPAGTMTIKENGVVTPISSRRTFPGKVRPQISAPYSTRTDPRHVRGRRVPRQRPPNTTWSNATADGSYVAPGWAHQRLVNDPDSMDTNLWVRRHNGQNGDLVQRPLFIANDLETDKDFLVTPRGTKKYLTRKPPSSTGDLNDVNSHWIPAGYYEEPSYPRVKRVHRYHDEPDYMSLPDPHIIDVPHVPIHHYRRPYSLPSYVGHDPRRYPPRTFVPHRDLKPRPLPPSGFSGEVGSNLPARLVELTPDGPREMPKLAATIPDEASLEPNQGSLKVRRDDSRLEHFRGAYDNEMYRRHDYLPHWGYYVETPPSPGQSMKPRQGSAVDRNYQKRPVPCNSRLMSPRSISKSMRAEHGSTITTASEKPEREVRREYVEDAYREDYGDDDYGDGYRGNRFKSEMPRGERGGGKRGRVTRRGDVGRGNPQGQKRNQEWGRRFADFSNDDKFPFTLRGFLKIAEMIVSLLIIVLALVDNSKWSASIFVAVIGIIGFVVALGSFVFRFIGFHVSAAIPCLWFELIVYGLVVLCMLAAGILSAISATVANTVAAVTFFCFLATILFAFDAVLMGQAVKQKSSSSDLDDDQDSQDGGPRNRRGQDGPRDDRRGPRDDRRGPRDDRRGPRDNRRGQRSGGREDYGGRQNRGYDERY